MQRRTDSDEGVVGEGTQLLQTHKSHTETQWHAAGRRIPSFDQGSKTGDERCLPRVVSGAALFATVLFAVYHVGTDLLQCKPGVWLCKSPFEEFNGPAVHEFALNSKLVSRLVVTNGQQKLRQAEASPGEASEQLEIPGPSLPTAVMASMQEMPPWFREATKGAHVHDRRPVRALKKLMSQIAVDNTVIILSTNFGFFNLTLNLLCRLRDIGVTNVLTWALDRESADSLRERGIPYYHDSSRFAVSKYTSYFDSDYIRMMIERVVVWWRLLATGHDLLFLDSDVVSFRNPMSVFPRIADLEGQIDARYWPAAEDRGSIPEMCGGAFWLRSSPRTLKVLDKMRASIEEHALTPQDRYDDQYALNSIVRDPRESVVLNRGYFVKGVLRESDLKGKLRVLFIEPTAIMGGRLEKLSDHVVDPWDFYNITFVYRNRRSETQRQVTPAIFHLNGRGMEYIKLKMLHKAGWWEVRDDGQCRTTAGMITELEERKIDLLYKQQENWHYKHPSKNVKGEGIAGEAASIQGRTEEGTSASAPAMEALHAGAGIAKDSLTAGARAPAVRDTAVMKGAANQRLDQNSRATDWGAGPGH